VTASLLLDTYALIWLLNGDEMESAALDAVEKAASDGSLNVSAITAWEVATLEAKGRITLTMPVETWFERAENLPGLDISVLSAKILMASTRLPGTPPNDPADRMIIATAREQAMSVVTRDQRILSYAEQGYISAIKC
jgi:PIN domain nuclease of toxin-antitoxin system